MSDEIKLNVESARSAVGKLDTQTMELSQAVDFICEGVSALEGGDVKGSSIEAAIEALTNLSDSILMVGGLSGDNRDQLSLAIDEMLETDDAAAAAIGGR